MYDVMSGDTTIERVKSYNYLGVSIDEKLTFDMFLKEKCKKNQPKCLTIGKNEEVHKWENCECHL